MEQRRNTRPTNDKTHKKAPYPLASSRENTYRNPAENTKKYIKIGLYRHPYTIHHRIRFGTTLKQIRQS